MTCAYLFDNVCVRTKQACNKCAEFLEVSDPGFLTKWKDSLVVLSRNRVPVTESMRDLLAGSSVFLLCGGPSANNLDLSFLSRRGIWTMAVNNVCGHPQVRPQAMVCSDPPSKFTHSVWLDPGVMKFVPIPKLSPGRGKLRRKLDGKFLDTDRTTVDSPNVWGFQRNSWLWPDDRFFLSDGACWGNHDAGVKKTGEDKTVCTMLLAIRIIRFLGAKRLYLLGVDFHMSPSSGYSFAQSRDEGACASNNNQYVVVNDWLCRMQQAGVFARFGMDVFNCYQKSGLRAFPYVPFYDAIMDAQGWCETIPDLVDWYLK